MVKHNSHKSVTASNPKIKKKINDSLNESLVEGSFSSTFNSLNASYITPYALAMQATSSQVGILGAIAMLLPSISQLLSVKLIEKYSRKKIMIIGAILSALIWIPIMFASLLFFNNISYAVWALISLVGLFYLFSGIIYPAWFSLMGSIVPEKERGRYFSKRNRRAQFFGVLSMILSAFFLDFMKNLGSVAGEVVAYTFFGFFTIFTIGMIARSFSAFLMSKQYAPRLKLGKRDHYTLRQFIKNIKKSPFGRFSIFNGVFKMAAGIASPFFAVYLLKELGYSYTWFIIVTISSLLFQIYFLKVMGKMSDKFGNILVTKITTTFIALTPLVWAVSYYIPASNLQILYLIFFAQLINGIGWGGYNLSIINYVYDASKEKRQGYAIAYMNLFNGVGYFIGAMFGAFIVQFGFFAINTIVIIFLISFIARGLTILIGSKYLKEVKNVKEFEPEYLLHEIHPIKEAMTEVHHLNHLSSKVIHHI